MMNVHAIATDATRQPGQIEQRLAALRQEYESGQTQWRALRQRTRELRDTMQRITGAMAVLEELLAQERVDHSAE